MFFRIFFFLLCIYCYPCTQNISETAKKEYGHDFNLAFAYQSEGKSTHATYYFEQGCMKAMKAGETPQKIEAIRKLFVWYRTYGYFLGIIKNDPNIIGQYIGNGRYSTYNGPPIQFQYLGYGRNPEKDARVREYLFGVVQILSGMLCIWLGPPPVKAVGAYLVTEGVDRAWDTLNSAWLQKDIALIEYQKTGQNLKTAATM